MEELTERQKLLLALVVHEHIRTAQAVASVHLVETYRLDMSSATVRLKTRFTFTTCMRQCCTCWASIMKNSLTVTPAAISG